jgi:hypothetical protein
VNVILAFGSRMISFGWGSLPLMSRNKSYLCIGLSLFGADLLFKLKISHKLTDFVRVWNVIYHLVIL